MNTTDVLLACRHESDVGSKFKTMSMHTFVNLFAHECLTNTFDEDVVAP